MARNKKTSKLKEPIRLRMKDLSNGNKSLYLDIYRDGKRSYEYLKMYIIPETDDDARKRNQATLKCNYHRVTIISRCTLFCSHLAKVLFD